MFIQFSLSRPTRQQVYCVFFLALHYTGWPSLFYGYLCVLLSFISLLHWKNNKEEQHKENTIFFLWQHNYTIGRWICRLCVRSVPKSNPSVIQQWYASVRGRSFRSLTYYGLGMLRARSCLSFGTGFCSGCVRMMMICARARASAAGWKANITAKMKNRFMQKCI